MSHDAVHGAESPPPAGKGRPLDPESPSLDDSPQPKKPRAEDEEESRLGGRSPAPGSPHAHEEAAMTSQLQHGTLSQAEEEAEEDDGDSLQLHWQVTQAPLGDDEEDEEKDDNDDDDGSGGVSQSLDLMPTGSINRERDSINRDRDSISSLPLSEQMIQLTRLRETLAAERAVAEGEAKALKGKIDALQAYRSERQEAREKKEKAQAKEQAAYVATLKNGAAELHERCLRESAVAAELAAQLKQKQAWLSHTEALTASIARATE